MNNKKIKLSAFAAAFILCVAVPYPISAGEAINSDEALKLLSEGNARFVKMKLQHPNETIEQRGNTAVIGQAPFATVLACSDSRVPVEAIFDRGIGDIFVVRVAGNIANDNIVIGSVEYAVGYLHTPLLVIMGHTGCGAVKAAVDDSAVEGKIRDIKNQIRPVAVKTKKEHPDLSGADLLNTVAKNNVLQAKRDLLRFSHEVKKMADEGKLSIVTAVYDIRTGKVEWVD